MSRKVSGAGLHRLDRRLDPGPVRTGRRRRVEILALTAGRNVEKLAEQALRWRPQVAVIEDENRLPELRERLAGSGVRDRRRRSPRSRTPPPWARTG